MSTAARHTDPGAFMVTSWSQLTPVPRRREARAEPAFEARGREVERASSWLSVFLRSAIQSYEMYDLQKGSEKKDAAYATSE